MKYLTIACLATALFGCAADGSQSADPAPRNQGSYQTGSRLPTYEPAGNSAAREVSKDDWIDDRRTGGNMGNAR